MNKQEKGNWGEELACHFLAQKGYVILERNFRSRFGELDIVARDDDTLVFVEVRTRRGDFLSAMESVGPAKKMHFRRAVLSYLVEKGKGEEIDIRLDVIGIEKDCIEHIKGAVEFDRK